MFTDLLRITGPIITSLMAADFYKFPMMQFIFLLYRDVRVKFRLQVRTKIRLADIIPIEELRAELDHVRTFAFNNSELHYLRGTNEYGDRMFREEFLQALKRLRLPAYTLYVKDGNFVLEFEGLWWEVTLWETLALSILNELYYRNQLKKMTRFERDRVYAEGVNRLMEKVRELRRHRNVTFSDFGTRRRFSHGWQKYLNAVLIEELPEQFVGTSCTQIAMEVGLEPKGTNAHEQPMALAALSDMTPEGIRESQTRLWNQWWDLYGWGLSIFLPDTFGLPGFLKYTLTPEMAAKWKGSRADSMDPIAYGEQWIEYYQQHGINSREKLLIPSDGLELPLMIRVSDHFDGRIKVSHGWGTNLTNDLGLSALSMVIKLVEANGVPTVKLSDNLAKAMGPANFLEIYKATWGYQEYAHVECKY